MSESKDSRIFAVVFAVVFFAGLFAPTIELYKGSVSLGHAPVWLAYIGILLPEYQGLSIAIVAVHVAVTFAVASCMRRAVRWSRVRMRQSS